MDIYDNADFEANISGASSLHPCGWTVKNANL